MKVNVEETGEVSLPDDSKVSDLVEKLDYHLDSVIVLSEDEPLPIDHELKDDMDIKIISVVSGG